MPPRASTPVRSACALSQKQRYGLTTQLPAAHDSTPQSMAPPQLITQPPPSQFSIVHVSVFAQSNVHPPPLQSSMLHTSVTPSQVTLQLPTLQPSTAQPSDAVHVASHPPLSQSTIKSEPVPAFAEHAEDGGCEQSRKHDAPSPHSSLHVALVHVMSQAGSSSTQVH